MSFFRNLAKLFTPRTTPSRIFLDKIRAGSLPTEEARREAERSIAQREDLLRAQGVKEKEARHGTIE